MVMTPTDTCSVCKQEIPEGQPAMGLPKTVFCVPCLEATGKAMEQTIEKRDRREHWRDWLTIHRNKEGKVEGVELPLTPAEWCQCCMREGDHYLGGCCGNLSQAQDLLSSMFRDGGTADAWDLYRWYSLVRAHDGYNEADLPTPSATATEDPVTRILAVCEEINAEGPSGGWVLHKMNRPRPVDVTDLDTAIRVIAQNTWALNYGGMFKGEGPDEDNKHRVQTIVNLAKTIPALRTLFDKLHEKDLGPLDGFGLFSDKTGEIMDTWAGLAIYPSVEACHETATLWAEVAGEDDEDIGTFTIRRVQVTVEEGLTVIED